MRQFKVRFLTMFFFYLCGDVFAKSFLPNSQMKLAILLATKDMISVILMMWWIGFMYPEKKDSSSL